MTDIGVANQAALRRIAIASTGMQMILEQIIWELLSVDEQSGRAVTERTSAGWLAERLEVLAKRVELDPPLADEVVELARAAKRAIAIRNENLHGTWIAIEEGRPVRLRSLLVDGREGPEFQLEFASASGEELTRVAEAMEDLAGHAHDLLVRVRAVSHER